MSQGHINYFLFPHTVLAEKDYRHLSILFPQLQIFQTTQPPLVPVWGEPQFSGWPVIRDQDQANQLLSCLRAYEELTEIHGRGDVLAFMDQDWAVAPSKEAPSRIRQALVDRNCPTPDRKQGALLEAAVFLDMARAHDEREIELESTLDRVDDLEAQFREILGINSEDDLEEAIETLSPPLTRESARLSFMIPRRMGFWLRLFQAIPVDGPFALMALSPEIQEELFDPFRVRCDRACKKFNLETHTLGVLPNLSGIQEEDFLKVSQNLKSSGQLPSAWELLDKVLADPADPELRDALHSSIKAIGKEFFPACGTTKSQLPAVRLNLTVTRDCTCKNLWQCFDKNGYEVLGESGPHMDSAPLLLYLS